MALRLYLGMEYECPRGHRFFCSGPDKIFKAPSSGIFKVCVRVCVGYGCAACAFNNS